MPLRDHFHPPLPPLFRWQSFHAHWASKGWPQRLEFGDALPSLPLWLAADLAAPLDLEESYQTTCTSLRLPSVWLAGRTGQDES